MVKVVRILSAVGALAWAVAPAAHADWLVTREGARLETKGPWTVRGKLVVFTLPNGALSSVRLDLVDLEASDLATRQAKEDAEKAATEPPPPPKKKSVRSFTDKDFKPVTPPDEADAPAAPAEPGATPDAAPGAAEGGPPSAAGTVEVVSWDRPAEPTEGLLLAGTVRNGTAGVATDVAVVAQLYDEEGTLLARLTADLEASSLQPGESTTFKISSTETPTFSAVKFQVKSRGFKSQQPQ